MLAVCTGNICRSAYVQHTLQAQLTALLGERGAAVVRETLSSAQEPGQGLIASLFGFRPAAALQAATPDRGPDSQIASSFGDRA